MDAVHLRMQRPAIPEPSSAFIEEHAEEIVIPAMARSRTWGHRSTMTRHTKTKDANSFVKMGNWNSDSSGSFSTKVFAPWFLLVSVFPGSTGANMKEWVFLRSRIGIAIGLPAQLVHAKKMKTLSSTYLPQINWYNWGAVAPAVNTGGGGAVTERPFAKGHLHVDINKSGNPHSMA
jgi:hypothetical protein